MRQFTADVYFQDEAEPKIKTGWRRVRIKVGSKWLRIEELASGRRARIQRWPLDGRTMKRFDRLEHFKMRVL